MDVLKRSLIRNRKLPTTTVSIGASVEFLECFNIIGLKAEPIFYPRLSNSEYNFINCWDWSRAKKNIDDKKKYIVIGEDANNVYKSILSNDHVPDNIFCLHGGTPMRPVKNCIGGPWGGLLYQTQQNNLPFAKNINLQDKKGWTVLFGNEEQNKTFICEYLAENKWMFNYEHTFAYDGCPPTINLDKYMFREKYDKDAKEKIMNKIGYDNWCLTSYENNYEVKLIEITVGSEGINGTLSDQLFDINDKHCRPIAQAIPMVVIGSNPKWLRRFRQMGFKSFHPYIDESYDLIEDKKDRCNAAMESVNKFLQSGQHLDKIQEICEHNQKHLLYFRDTYDHDTFWSKKIQRFLSSRGIKVPKKQ